MRPAVVFPFHDPEGTTFVHLQRVLPHLKALFERAYLGVTPPTRQRYPEQVRALAQDDFFSLYHAPSAPVGDQFAYLYQQAAAAAPDRQVLHLCFSDRLAFALQSQHQRSFIEAVSAVSSQDTPLLFARSPAAWESHPHNYYEIERFATTVGDLLFGRRLDFTWCHLAICASQLREAMTQVENHDLSMLAEIVLAVRESVQMREVDWLAWEDPFFLERPLQALKAEREDSPLETEKRLAYVISTVQTLTRHAH